MGEDEDQNESMLRSSKQAFSFFGDSPRTSNQLDLLVDDLLVDLSLVRKPLPRGSLKRECCCS